MVPVTQRIHSDDLVVLLGAGASVEAGIPASYKMIEELEGLLEKEKDWREYRALYHQVKSGIYFAAGIQGKFDGRVTYNIETLVNTLHELERNEDHPIYPFIGSWNSRLLALAGHKFERVSELKEKIERQLQVWVQPGVLNADYYDGLRTIQGQIEHPLRVFSLNYDVCVEDLARGNAEFTIEGGFGPNGREKWAWKRFGEESASAKLYLYKLHGSINWKRDENGELTQVRYAGNNVSKLQVIFGRQFKLEAADPYLLYVSEFRRLTLQARLVLVIGYSFGDEHINKMLHQAFRLHPEKRMLVVDYCRDGAAESERLGAITEAAGVDRARVTLLPEGAKSFLSDPDVTERVRAALPVAAGDTF